MFSASAPMAGYPKVYSIEMDPHEDLQVGALFGWTAGAAREVVEKYLESVKKYPNPPAPSITQFGAEVVDGSQSTRVIARPQEELILRWQVGIRRVAVVRWLPSRTIPSHKGGAIPALPPRSPACGGNRPHSWSARESRGGLLWHQ
jgi:hypothetical protein